ncbi:MAG: UDP-N-acetylmuramate dehydrogenase [Actinomycetota bacterium]|nr:UDP-N-acetylmuramate dehydrogenase [Actinomycetota bacterium]
MSTNDDIAPRVAEALDTLGPRGHLDVPLGPLTTYRVGGRAAVAVTVATLADAAAVARAVDASGLPVLIVGRGSNLLVAQQGFAGIAVLVAGSAGQAGQVGGATPFLAVAIDRGSGERTEVVAGAGVPLPTLARRSAEAGLQGLEWAVGVPGSVGGGIRMNAGGHGSDMAASVIAVTVADLSVAPVEPDRPVTERRTLERMLYGYRSSSIEATDLVLDARFVTRAGHADEARRTIRDIVAWRREHQPGGQNAGSVFTNPVGDSAGRLIEMAGQKGRRWRSAMVSTKHANFIQADPGGSADDVRALVDQVREAVVAQTGVELHTEVRMIGWFG